jgi:ParB family chromosome partitioning protein
MSDRTTLPLSALRIDDKANVRHANRGVDPVLVASIRAIGLRQPLTVRPNGKGYLVVDGGQRLAALQALQKAGEFADNCEVPVIIRPETDAEAREVSLALNVARTAMHPVDEYRAFAALHTDKEAPLDPAKIAERFGVPVRAVEQRLALGSLDESVLKAWEDGTISGEVAKTFTLSTDKRLQAKALKTVLEGFVNPYRVREALGIGNNEAGKWIGVIGSEAYEARGGKITRDLFGEDHVVSDPALVQTMVGELVAATCELLVKDGWAWAKPDADVANDWQYGRLNVETKPTTTEKKRLKELAAICDDESTTNEGNEAASAEYDALETAIKLRAYTPQQKAKAGCFVSVAWREGLSVDYGRTEPKAAVAAKAATGGKEEAKKPVAAEDAIPGNLVTRLAEQLTAAAQATLDKSSNVALAAMLAGFASGDQACAVRAEGSRGRTAFETAFAAALKLSTAELVKELAKVAAKSVNLAKPYSKLPALEEKPFKALCEAIDSKALNAALREKFDAKDYFTSASRATIVEAVREAMGDDHAATVAKMDKASAVKFAVGNVSKTKWLPKQLRVSGYDGPARKASAKKTAKAKR